MIKTKHTTESIRDTFVTGFAGILKTTGYKKIFFSNWLTYLPIIVSIVGVLATWLLGIAPLRILLELKSTMINFLPGILGFSIAGYSMMVAFIQVGMLDKITEPSRDSKYSLYQRMSAILAINILIQAVALILAYFIHFVNFLDTVKTIPQFFSSKVNTIINYIGLLLLGYWFSISVFMVVQIILNIFGFSQLHHYFVNKAKVDSQNNTPPGG